MTSTTPSPVSPIRKRDRAARVIRTLLMAAVLLCGFGLFALRSAYARANDAALIFSQQLLALDSSGAGAVQGEATRLNMNEQQVLVNSTATPRPIREVLDYFEVQCRDHAQGMTGTFAHLDGSLRTMAPSSGASGFGVMKRVAGDKGLVACLSADHALEKEEMAARLEQAVVTGNLGKLGGLRYVAVETAGAGSHVVALWTEGDLNLARMFPKEGDAPGRDWPGTPRPAGSRRLLSAYAEGTSYGVNVYTVPGEAGAVRASIDDDLHRAGWTGFALPKGVPDVGSGYWRPGATGADLVVAVKDAGGGKSSVSYVYSTMVNATAR
jgi:hypothetical protein